MFFKFVIPEVGNIVVFQTHTPLTPMLLQTQFRYYADAHIPRLLVSYVVGNWVSQWANDLLMWENKIHIKKPLLVKGDGPVARLRRWYYQFYSSGEPKVTLTSSDASAVTAAATPAVKNTQKDACPAAGAADW